MLNDFKYCKIRKNWLSQDICFCKIVETYTEIVLKGLLQKFSVESLIPHIKLLNKSRNIASFTGPPRPRVHFPLCSPTFPLTPQCIFIFLTLL